MNASRLTFRRQQRLRLQRDFERVFGQRCSVGDGRWLVLYVAANGLGYHRLGLRVGKRFG